MENETTRGGTMEASMSKAKAASLANLEKARQALRTKQVYAQIRAGILQELAQSSTNLAEPKLARRDGFRVEDLDDGEDYVPEHVNKRRKTAYPNEDPPVKSNSLKVQDEPIQSDGGSLFPSPWPTILRTLVAGLGYILSQRVIASYAAVHRNSYPNSTYVDGNQNPSPDESAKRMDSGVNFTIFK
jgi:hypothetical protein